MELPPTPESTPKKIGNLLNWNNAEYQRLEEELMTTRLREMEALSELKELRLKVNELRERLSRVVEKIAKLISFQVMELETQVQVSGNQLKRQDEDKKDLKEQLENAEAKEKELSSKLRDQHYRYADLESKVRRRATATCS